jgi:sterol O-acyltransferase
VIVLLISDGIMCGLTGFGFLHQKLVFAGWINWNRSGWIIQNVGLRPGRYCSTWLTAHKLWQTAFIGAVIELTLIRDWPWTHTVFFVLHGLVMVMKQHSYAFYNGHLSSVYKKRQQLEKRLKQLESISPVSSPSKTSPPSTAISTSHLSQRPSASKYRERRLSLSKGTVTDGMERISHAITSNEPLDVDQLQLFERMIKWEIDALTDELRGKATNPSHYYPNNLTLLNHYEFIVLPTLVYELEYPRSDSINWLYVAEKISALFGVIFVMIMVSQAFIYPVVMRTVIMKEEGWTLAERFREFPWMLSDLLFPFMMEYLVSNLTFVYGYFLDWTMLILAQMAWYLIWETVLNTLAELTYFADRSFYDAWWNSGKSPSIPVHSSSLLTFYIQYPGTSSHEIGTVPCTTSC